MSLTLEMFTQTKKKRKKKIAVKKSNKALKRKTSALLRERPAFTVFTRLDLTRTQRRDGGGQKCIYDFQILKIPCYYVRYGTAVNQDEIMVDGGGRRMEGEGEGGRHQLHCNNFPSNARPVLPYGGSCC